jgi:hypothetical protein
VNATLAAVDGAIRVDIDRGDVLGADVTLRVDPHGGDDGGAQVVFRELFVAGRLARTRQNENQIRSEKSLPRRGDPFYVT